MKHLEIECKWDANTTRAFTCAQDFLKSLGLKITPKKLKIKDTYLDHATGDLSAQKIALRVRNTNGKWQATFKTRTEIKNCKAIRREETLPLPRVKNLTQALQGLAQKKSWQKINTLGLEIKFALANKRTICVFDYDGATLEMALDAVTLYIVGRQVKFKEIEVELKRGKSAVLEQFCRAFSAQTKLKRAQTSKVKTAETFLKFWKK